MFLNISDIHLVYICKKRYNTIIGKLLQEELIYKHTYAKKETRKVLFSHDDDTSMEPQEAVKKKQSTDNRIEADNRIGAINQD